MPKFVNNYCESFENLKIEEDGYMNQINVKPAGFESDGSMSRSLCYVLRHGAKRDGFRLQPGGYVNVEDFLNHYKFRGKCCEEDFKRIVIKDEKNRYDLRNCPLTGKLQLRANQGHTIKVKEDGTLLQEITRETCPEVVVHGTTLLNWNSIRKQGLSRMRRNHIHFCPGIPGDAGVVSGYRQSSSVLITLNTAMAMFDGIKFFRSKNNVILSPGDARGFISQKYFKKVDNVKTGDSLLAQIQAPKMAKR